MILQSELGTIPWHGLIFFGDSLLNNRDQILQWRDPEGRNKFNNCLMDLS